MPEEKNLYLERERLLMQGSVNVKEIGIFIGCGYQRAKRAYNEIEKQIKSENKKVGMFGIPTKRLIAYLELSEKDVYKAADRARQNKKDASDKSSI